MSWQSDLHSYVALKEQIPIVEARGCSCDPDNFHSCESCQESAEMYQEMHRLLGLWGDLWACKLWRIAQKAEPVTQFYFGKEQPCNTAK